jgi:protein TonB
MNEAATDIIVARARETDRLAKMLVWSIAAHIVIVSVAVLLPTSTSAPPRTVMMISLGGAEGPNTQGMSQLGGRAVQAPEPEPLENRAVTPPAPTPPPIVAPEPRTRPQPPRPQPRQAPREATARTPSRGPEPVEGSTRVDTGARGQGFGLSSSGGGGSGIRTDVDFCCRAYLDQISQAIKRNWEPRQRIQGITTMVFTIHRDGRITDVQVERSSGFVVLDAAAQRALQLARLPPLPREFTNPTLTVHLEFEYQR